MEIPLESVLQSEVSSVQDMEPVLCSDRLNDLVEFQMKNNPRMKGKTKRDIASECFISETSLKNMLSGRNVNPHISTVIRLVRYVGGGDMNILVGFAPARDYSKEEQNYDKTLVEGMQARLDEKRQRIAELTQQVEELQADKLRLQRMYNDASNRASSAEAEVKHLEIMKTTLYKERDERDDERKDVKMEHKRLRVALTVMCAVVILSLGACVYVLWDALNPAVGLLRR